MIVCSDERALQILDVVQPFLKRRGGVCLLSDVRWPTVRRPVMAPAARAHAAAPWQLRGRGGVWARWQPARRADDHSEVAV